MDANQTTSSVPKRLLRLGAAVGRRYAVQAREEASQDGERILLGLALAGLALVAAAHCIAALHGVAVVALLAAGITPLHILAGVAVVDIVLALLLAWSSRRLLSQPLLHQTRARLQELTEILRDA